MAVSGGKASFLAGGEFPYPVPQGLNQITLEFRQYGVKLNFTPTVQDNGLIRLAVAPEVSQLDQANSLKINGVQVPGLITRKADTTVEIKDGDSLALGGIFMHTYNNDLRQFPGLGDIPILGALFRSARWARNETELMIIVTPHIVTARDFEKAAKTVDVAGKEPTAAAFMINGVTKDPHATCAIIAQHRRAAPAAARRLGRRLRRLASPPLRGEISRRRSRLRKVSFSMSTQSLSGRRVLAIGPALAGLAAGPLAGAEMEQATLARLIGVSAADADLIMIDADAWADQALAAGMQALTICAQPPPPVLLVGSHLPTAVVRNLLRLERSDVLDAPYTPETSPRRSRA